MACMITVDILEHKDAKDAPESEAQEKIHIIKVATMERQPVRRSEGGGRTAFLVLDCVNHRVNGVKRRDTTKCR